MCEGFQCMCHATWRALCLLLIMGLVTCRSCLVASVITGVCGSTTADKSDACEAA